MAKFEIAYDITAKYEGGYVNDPDDTGGETIFGVARNSWKNLGMWSILDDYKARGLSGRLLENACKSDEKFMNEVHDVYKNQYWAKIWGDKIEDQKNANAIYDWAVNSGVSRAVRVAQLVLGSAAGTADGVMGNKTLLALNADQDFLNKYIDSRITFYKQLVEKRPSNAKFLKGWCNRAEWLR